MKDDIKIEIADEQAFETGNTLYLSDVITRVKAEFEANATSLRSVLADLNAVSSR